jgi:hypothetical protein
MHHLVRTCWSSHISHINIIMHTVHQLYYKYYHSSAIITQKKYIYIYKTDCPDVKPFKHLQHLHQHKHQTETVLDRTTSHRADTT